MVPHRDKATPLHVRRSCFGPLSRQRRVSGGAAGYRPRVRSAYFERVYAHSHRYRCTYGYSRCAGICKGGIGLLRPVKARRHRCGPARDPASPARPSRPFPPSRPRPVRPRRRAALPLCWARAALLSRAVSTAHAPDPLPRNPRDFIDFSRFCRACLPGLPRGMPCGCSPGGSICPGAPVFAPGRRVRALTPEAVLSTVLWFSDIQRGSV